MASRNFNRVQALDKELKIITGHCTITGSTGAIIVVSGSGVASGSTEPVEVGLHTIFLGNIQPHLSASTTINVLRRDRYQELLFADFRAHRSGSTLPYSVRLVEPVNGDLTSSGTTDGTANDFIQASGTIQFEVKILSGNVLDGVVSETRHNFAEVTPDLIVDFMFLLKNSSAT